MGEKGREKPRKRRSRVVDESLPEKFEAVDLNSADFGATWIERIRETIVTVQGQNFVGALVFREGRSSASTANTINRVGKEL